MSGIGAELDFLGKMHDVAALRHRAISSNLARSGVDGESPVVVRFEERLADALSKGGDPRGVEPSVSRGQGPISMEKEIGELGRNTLLFKTWSRLLSLKLKGLRSAMGAR